jgi:hypothetical protein
MATPTQPPSSSLKTILGAIIIALIAGSSSPWWWDRAFPKHPPASTIVTKPELPAQTPGSSDPPVSRFVMSALQYDKAYLQEDLYSRPTANPEDCSDLCMHDERCRAMTYIKSQQLCWIKHSVEGGSASTPDMISAVKQEIK